MSVYGGDPTGMCHSPCRDQNNSHESMLIHSDSFAPCYVGHVPRHLHITSCFTVTRAVIIAFFFLSLPSSLRVEGKNVLET